MEGGRNDTSDDNVTHLVDYKNRFLTGNNFRNAGARFAQIPSETESFATSQGHETMDDNDKDVRRLEDRIVASEERSQLRLENAIARIEGQVGRLFEQSSAMRQDFAEQREEARLLRKDLHDSASRSADAISSSRSWIIGTIIAATITVGGSVIAVEIGLRQFWLSGVQTAISGHSVQPP